MCARGSALFLLLLLQAQCEASLPRGGDHGRHEAPGARKRMRASDEGRRDSKAPRAGVNRGEQGHSAVFLRDSIDRVAASSGSHPALRNSSACDGGGLKEAYRGALEQARNRTRSFLHSVDPLLLRYAGIETREDLEKFMRDPLWKKNITRELEQEGERARDRSMLDAMKSEADAWCREPEQSFHAKMQYSARAANLAESILQGRRQGENTSALEAEGWLLSQGVPWLKAQLRLRNVSIANALDKSDLVSLLMPFANELLPQSRRGEESGGARERGFERLPVSDGESEKEDSYSSKEMERYGFDSSLKKSTPKNKTGFSHGRQTKQGRDGSMYTKMRFSREPSVVLPSKKPWHYAEFLDDNRLAGKIKVHADDRFGRKTSVYAKPTDTIQDLKVLIGEKIGRDPRSLILQKCKQVYNDKITLSDYEVHDGMNFELSYHRAYIFDT